MRELRRQPQMDLIYPSVWRGVAGERGGDWEIGAGLAWGYQLSQRGGRSSSMPGAFWGTGRMLMSRVPAAQG